MIEQLLELKTEMSLDVLQSLATEQRKDNFRGTKDSLDPFFMLDDSFPGPKVRRLTEGRVFGDRAYLDLSVMQPAGLVLLSGRRTFEFYKYLYSNKDVCDGILWQEPTVMGITTPDGLIVDDTGVRPRIVKVCEFTATGYEPLIEAYINKKCYGFERAREDYPGIFADSKLLFVTPSESRLASVVRMRPKGYLETAELPISRKELYELVDDLMEVIPAQKGEMLWAAA